MFIEATGSYGTLYLRADQIDAVCPTKEGCPTGESIIVLRNREEWWVEESTATIMTLIGKVLS